jgi:hypothetical protein
LAAHDDKRAVGFGISARLVNAIEMASVHVCSRRRRLVCRRLVIEGIFRFAIEAIGSGIDAKQISSMKRFAGALPKIATKNALDKR